MDITPVLIWWWLLLMCGVVGWPLAFSVLPHLPDRGYTVARSVGLLLSGYILWLGASFRLLQNSVGGIVLALVVVLVVGLLWHRQQVRAGRSEPMWAWLKREWGYVVIVETLFIVAFVGWAYVRAHNPNIETAGGEKWMEIAFINGTLRSDYFPPQDPWLSGFAISYYYFGYVLMAKLTQLSGLLSVIAFNLYIPTLFTLTLTASLGIVANLVSLHQKASQVTLMATFSGLLAAVFVGVMGNLTGFLESLHQRQLLPMSFWEWLDIRDLNQPPQVAEETWVPQRFFWWWRASRTLTDYNLAGGEQEVIDEFPFFSFLLGDVHPHVLALPFVLLVVILALNIIYRPVDPLTENERGGLLGLWQRTWQELLSATGGRFGLGLHMLCLGALSFLNTWDFPIYLGVVGLALTVRSAQRYPDWRQALWPGGLGMVILGIGGILLYLPFYATFSSQARGILPNLWNPTFFPQFFVFFGPFLLASLAFLLVLSWQIKGWPRHLNWTLFVSIWGPVMVLIVVVTAVMLNASGREFLQGVINDPAVQAAIGVDTVGGLVQESLWRRVADPWTFLIVGGLLGWGLALLVAGSERPLAEKFALILLLTGLGLPLVVEFIYLRDNFGTRMNTIFKFYFQAWVLLALASAFAVYYVSTHARNPLKYVWQLAMMLLVAGGLFYPVLATAYKTDNFQPEPTLNGIAWMAEHRSADYAAIAWLRENAPDHAVILEAPGDRYASYNYTGRISAMTGIPTLLGWGGHQSQWRGNYDEPARREPDIEALFNTLDLQQAQMLLDKYNIMYVYVGPEERRRYNPQGLSKFDRLMEVAFQHQDATIYQR